METKVGANGPLSVQDGRTSTCIDWFSEGESKQVECSGVTVTVRFVGRKGRRGRILIQAPAGAVFSSCNSGAENATPIAADMRRSM